ncbi:MAG: EAL domain-containing protein [Campylobacterales bacterium]|nr:EAL domain-containing protein [Campylobacterales bacterium]
MISDLIHNKQIDIHFQPIVSIKDNRVFAYEALTRSIDRYDEPISPLYLFEQAKKEDIASKLDEYVRELALLKFQTYLEKDASLLLFVKFDNSVIEKEQGKEFISTVYKYNIPPKNIVVSIKEEKIRDTHLLKSFIDLYKKHGFLVALDDFGTAYGSFERLEYLRPEIVKVDRSLVYNVQNNLISSELLSAIANMSHNVGALVIAEGVEHKDEVMASLLKKIDLFQGFWFSRVQESFNDEKIHEIGKSIEYIARMYKEHICHEMDEKRAVIQSMQRLMHTVVNLLSKNGMDSLEPLESIIAKNRKIEAIYIIEEQSGVQLGNTLIHSQEKHLFKPTKAGKNHLLSEYYFILKESLRDEYLSNPYVSRASGNVCRTYAQKVSMFEDNYIVCFDIVE